MSIKKALVEMLNNPFLGEKDYGGKLIDIIYEEYKEMTLKLFLQIQERDKKRIEEENNKLLSGVESGMHCFAHLSRELLENKTSKQAKSYLKFAFDGQNLAYLIDICKAYFPNGNSKNASNNGKWFFNQFKRMVEENREQYEEGGESYQWAVQFNHIDYIKLVLTQSKENK